MELFFKTRDLGPKCDYPAIGWMPMLQEDDRLPWIRFGAFGNMGYPQIAVSSNGGRWQVYIESLDSGRTDSPSGIGGRIIRMSLYVTGVKEEGKQVVGLVARYVRDVLRDGREDTLKGVFADCIKPGDPFHWKQDGEIVQKVAADKLLQRLLAVSADATGSDGKSVESKNGFWAAGMSSENAERFISVCDELLAGSRQGTALALSRMQLSNVGQILSLAAKDSPLVAILSLAECDKGAVIRNVAGGGKASVGASSHAQKRQQDAGHANDQGEWRHNEGDGSGGGSKFIGRCFFVGGMMVGAAIVILAIAKACISDRGKNATVKQQPVSKEGVR